jgi:hypothetical protein
LKIRNVVPVKLAKMNFSVGKELPETEYSSEARHYIRLLHKSFAIQMKKLEDAYAIGIITDKEYDQWVEFFEKSKKELLEKDFTRSCNVIFLGIIAKHNMEIARKITFTWSSK